MQSRKSLKAFVITLENHAYSEACAARCIDSAQGIEIERFRAVTADEVGNDTLYRCELVWSWMDSGQCPNTSLHFHRYGGSNARIACALSHYFLWQLCVREGPLLILEHDAVFVRPFEPFEFDSICQINDPRGATPNGAWWSDEMVKRGPGVWPKTKIFDDRRPDGLAGNSAYVIKPEAADHMIELAHRVGLWPNDALMCRQLVPNLQELYPFMTRVEQTESTTT